MIKFEKTCVLNMENAMRGARNPLESWARSDSYYDADGAYVLGENDLSLASRLCRAGSDHRKFIRQIFVSVDITAPIYWWKEYDTYRLGPLQTRPVRCIRFTAGRLNAAISATTGWTAIPLRCSTS